MLNVTEGYLTQLNGLCQNWLSNTATPHCGKVRALAKDVLRGLYPFETAAAGVVLYLPGLGPMAVEIVVPGKEPNQSCKV